MVKPKLVAITPCGDEISIHRTATSMVESNIGGLFDLTWVIIYNNGVEKALLNQSFEEFALIQLVHSDIASPALARNLGLDFASRFEDAKILMLDSGDYLVKEVSWDESLESYDLVHFNCIILSEDGVSYRHKNLYPVQTLRNPFYLGSVIFKLDFVGGIRFIPGRKEDWKFWIMVLKKGPKIFSKNTLLYVYTIKSRKNHVVRKSKLITEQYKFYSEFLGFYPIKALMYLVGHYLHAGATWLVKQRHTSLVGNIKTAP
jgi:hypothetical protein